MAQKRSPIARQMIAGHEVIWSTYESDRGHRMTTMYVDGILRATFGRSLDPTSPGRWSLFHHHTGSGHIYDKYDAAHRDACISMCTRIVSGQHPVPPLEVTSSATDHS